MDKKKILVIDDEKDLCLLVKLNLESTGEFDVTTAISGTEGVSKIKEEKFDLVITDFNMPDMNGDEVIEAIRKENTSLPILLFSVYHDDASTIPKSIRDKANGLISKPIDREELHNTINSVLAKNK